MYSQFTDILELPVSITGFPWLKENGSYNRIPEKFLKDLPEGLQWVSRQPSGGAIRFWTDSNSLALSVELLRQETSRQCSQALLSGFDVYVNGHFKGCLMEEENPISYTAEITEDLTDALNEVCIYFPLQNPVKSVKLKLSEGAKCMPYKEFANEKPILFYGSSITCGFSASRPGLTYPAIICRRMNYNFINLGFGGNAKGEQEIARAIASLDLSCFVMDYDHNSPDAEHLESTHYAFYKTIREARPNLPILLVSSPNYYNAPDYFAKKKKVIIETYERALGEGDKRIRFLDGSTIFPREIWEDCTTDLTHPNDVGFLYMSNAIQPELEKLLSI